MLSLRPVDSSLRRNSSGEDATALFTSVWQSRHEPFAPPYGSRIRLRPAVFVLRQFPLASRGIRLPRWTAGATRVRQRRENRAGL